MSVTALTAQQESLLKAVKNLKDPNTGVDINILITKDTEKGIRAMATITLFDRASASKDILKKVVGYGESMSTDLSQKLALACAADFLGLGE